MTLRACRRRASSSGTTNALSSRHLPSLMACSHGSPHAGLDLWPRRSTATRDHGSARPSIDSLPDGRPCVRARVVDGAVIAEPMPMAGFLPVGGHDDAIPRLGASHWGRPSTEFREQRLAAVACASRRRPSASRPIVTIPREMSSQPKTGKLSKAQKKASIRCVQT